MILPLTIKEKGEAKWQEAQICRKPCFFSACSVSLLLVTHVIELTVNLLPFPQDSTVSTVRYVNLHLQSKVSIPGKKFFCMHKNVVVKSTAETLQTEEICLIVQS